MNDRSTKTLYTCAWGNYWEKYGKIFIKQVNNLNTKPDQIFVVSDKELEDCPFEVIYADSNYKPYCITSFRQKAIDHTKCDWYCPVDIDDKMYPNYLDNLADDFDIHAHWPTQFQKHINVNEQNNIWNNLFKYKFFSKNDIRKRKKYNSIPMSGVSFVKKNKLKNIKIKKFGYQDQCLFYDLRKMNCTVYFDTISRFSYENIGLSNIHKRSKRIEQSKIFMKYFEGYKTSII